LLVLIFCQLIRPELFVLSSFKFSARAS